MFLMLEATLSIILLVTNSVEHFIGSLVTWKLQYWNNMAQNTPGYVMRSLDL